MDKISMLELDKYEFAFEVSPIPMLLVSASGVIVLTNTLFDQLFGYEPLELKGQSVDILVAGVMRGHHPELRNAYFKTPAKRNMGQGRDLNGITKSGHIIPLELGLDTVTVDGQTFALVVALDIQQRKLQQERMNLAMNAAASAMIMVDESGSIVFANKAAVELFGYVVEELLGSPIERLVPEKYKRVHPVYRGSFFSAGTARNMSAELEIFALHHDGHEIPVEIAITPVQTPEGKMVVSTIVDLTERVVADEAIARKSDELESLNDELMHFAYSASHDLKAPLSTMVGLLDLCIEDWDDGKVDDVRENILKVLNIGRRSAEKVEGVLRIALAGQVGISAEPICLKSIVQGIWLDLESANKDEVALILQLDHGEPPVLEKSTMKVILENLVSNALRYCDREKTTRTIEVRTKRENDSLILSVTDNGIGIPAKSHDAVFKMFALIDQRSEHGLGLALVKKQIDRLSGSIDFISTVGVGTEFTISIPLMDG